MKKSVAANWLIHVVDDGPFVDRRPRKMTSSMREAIFNDETNEGLFLF